MMLMMMVVAVLFFAAGPVRPARFLGNDDTPEEAAGETQGVSIVGQATGLPGGWPFRRRSLGQDPVFPGSGSK